MIDLHSAGRDYVMPHFVGYVETHDEIGERARLAAERFGAPLIWAHRAPMAPGRTLSAAYALGVPAIYIEGSGGESLEEAEVRSYVDGVLDVLAGLGMLDRPAAPMRPHRVVHGGGGDLDAGTTATHAGRFVADCGAGDELTTGDRIGRVLDESGTPLQDVVAPGRAPVMFLRRTARVLPGEVLCSLARAGG